MILLKKLKIRFLIPSIFLISSFIMMFFSFPEEVEARTQTIESNNRYNYIIHYSGGCTYLICTAAAGNNCNVIGSWVKQC